MVRTRLTASLTALRAAVVAMLALALALFATACGTTSDPVDNDTEASGDAITLTDGEGDEVVLPNGPATKIVALEWEQAEILTSLDVELVGVSDPEGYNSWADTTSPLSGDPVDVGTRGEPSVETIADLEPDLIVGAPRSIPDTVQGQMNDIAPVLLLSTNDPSDPLGDMAKVVETYGEAVGKSDEATALMDELHSALEENAAKIAEAGAEGTPVIFTSIYEQANSVTFRLEGPGTSSGAVFEALGLDVAWEGEFNDYGMAESDTEGLTTLPDDLWMFYWANDDGDDQVEEFLADNAVWESLPFVEAGQVRGVAEGVWLYGGPKALIQFSNEITEIITSE